jgi:small-conductance mechanosensitive channel
VTFLDPLLDRLEGSPGLQIGAVLLLTVLTAFVLEWINRRIFRRISARTRTDLDDRVFAKLHPAVRTTVLLLGVWICLPLLDLGEGVTRLGARIVRSILILLWSGTAIHLVSMVLRRVGGHRRIGVLQPRTVPLFDTLQKIIIFGAAAYLVFLTWQIDVTAWAASAGIVGIAVGFAARDTLANLFAGIFILMDSPYQVGDMVVFETGERGRVTEVGIRSTRILTRDDVEIIVPNSVIGTGRVTNESGGPQPKRRVDVRVGVSYASDIDQVRDVLLEVAGGLELACAEPAPRVRFREMADSALVFSLLFWVDRPEDRGIAIDAANTAIFKAFREAGVEIPFPQRVVHHVGSAPVATD